MIPNTEIKDRVIHYSLLITIVLFLVGIALLSLVIYREKELSDKMYPNTFIDNIHVGKMTKPQVAAILDKKYKNIDKVKLTVFYKDEKIATMSAKDLEIHSNSKEIIDRAYEVGRTPNISTRLYQKMATLFHVAPYSFTTDVSYDTGTIQDFISGIADQYDKPAKNALFSFEDGKVTTFRQHENGLMIETDTFTKIVNDSILSLKNKTRDLSVKVTERVVEPETKLSEANDLGIEELIGEGQSDYTHSTESRIHNLTLATSKFNGVIIPKGEEFSFNKTIGDVSTLTGYVPGYVILNGKTVLGDGGGVCQVSTTMFRAVMNTGLPITERHNHAYRVIYYENDAPAGYDATIYLPNVDFRFKNDTEGAILIETQIDPDNNMLYFKFYGKKDNRRVELGKPVLSAQTSPPPAVTQDDPTLPRGETKLIEHAIPGAKSTFTYKVYKGNEISFEKQFVSVYQAWAQVTLVGTKDG